MSEKEYAKIIAKNLKRISYDRGKNQTDISKDLGINKQTVSSWFRGERIPRMSKIDLLCNYLNCSRADIMEEHPEAQELQPYYLDAQTAQYMDKLLKHPEYRLLFDATNDIKLENVKLMAEMFKRFKESNRDG